MRTCMLKLGLKGLSEKGIGCYVSVVCISVNTLTLYCPNGTTSFIIRKLKNLMLFSLLKVERLFKSLVMIGC